MNIGADVIRDKYTGRVAEVYDKRAGSEKWKNEDRALEQFLSTIGEGSVLDIPVGTGRFLEFYKRRGMKAIGMDVSADMLAQARRKMPGADLRHGDILKIDMPNRSVDVAVAVRIMSWLTTNEMRRAMGELARVARTWIITGGGRSHERHEIARNVPGFVTIAVAAIDPSYERGDYNLVLLKRA